MQQPLVTSYRDL